MADQAFSAKHEQLRAEVENHLALYWSNLPPGLPADFSANGQQALGLLREFTMRPAKRIRGVLAVTGYELFGGQDRHAVLDLSVVMELTQSYLLIIDDVMDQSLLRRGGPTVQYEYRQQLPSGISRPAGTHAADMLAVTVGLLAQHLATMLLSRITAPAAVMRRLQQVFHGNLIVTSSGQMDDMLSGIGQSSDDLEQTLRMYGRKSGYYTFVNPLQTGAVLAGAGEADLKALREFGIHAGTAFQLQDDLLDMFGQERQTGKSTLDDLREGKLTVLMQHALVHADVAQLQVIRRALGNKRVSHVQHRAVQAVLEATGSRAFTALRAEQEVQAALHVLDSQPDWNGATVESLRGLLRSMLRREQ